MFIHVYNKLNPIYIYLINLIINYNIHYIIDM